MTTKVEPTVEKLRKKIEKLGNDVMRGNKIECKCPTCGDRAYGYDTEIKAKDSWIFVELSSLYERLLSHITEPTHSLISKIPSAYGVGSANLPEGDNWERKFDEAFEGTMCDGTGVDYGDTQREVKDFIRTLLSHSVQEAKAEERERILEAIQPAVNDFMAAANTLVEHKMVKTAKEMRENTQYIVCAIRGTHKEYAASLKQEEEK